MNTTHDHIPHTPVTTLTRHLAGFITSNGKWFIRKGTAGDPYSWFAFQRDEHGDLMLDTRQQFDTYGSAKYFVTHERNN
jgi:hypothetical protein